MICRKTMLRVLSPVSPKRKQSLIALQRNANKSTATVPHSRRSTAATEKATTDCIESQSDRTVVVKVFSSTCYQRDKKSQNIFLSNHFYSQQFTVGIVCPFFFSRLPSDPVSCSRSRRCISTHTLSVFLIFYLPSHHPSSL